MEKLRWGILATGYISGRFAHGLNHSHSGKLLAVSSRSQASAATFAREFDAGRAYGSHQELLADEEVEAVYIGSPHPFHAEMAIMAAKAGKHVLCEKPLSMNLRQAKSVAEAARKAEVQLMEAFMYRCHPQTEALVRLISEGRIGEVQFVQASFGFKANYDPQGRLFDKRLGGGAILDVGCYPLSFAHLIAQIASGETKLRGSLSGLKGQLDPHTGVDTFALATMRFENGLAAQIATGTLGELENTARVFGSEGWVEIPVPWIIARLGGEWELRLHRNGQEEIERISGYDSRPIYAIEADHFASLVRAEKPSAPGMTVEDSLRLARDLEEWRSAIGVSYPADAED
ncbi:Gfo/Idh/MocA family oxidoreductase [Pelagicoccus sp. SDUM812003]|uniref:Gfo/Idh/MocA family protein n=1 Tax=Pelagicoccus sp. SDUM812003 TaxID=3041267 RepID=UPI00280DF0F4|nr:Gfo/Idh/MocA family oxidoreductase [Pelagicoccus sp. SDUM812003]MDQ8205338.1 Gfo/Idh/MocA family oxidoreductase [Pelagicoccus sp. SDUM812003]